MFKEEKRIYESEGLEKYVEHIRYTDNQGIIDLLDKQPGGIFNLLDDSCAIAGTDETFLNKVKQAHPSNPYFYASKVSQQQPLFTVRHTAKDVVYSVKGFRQKNKDEINKQVLVTLSKSKNKLISSIFSEHKQGEKYLASKIKKEMQTLMQELTQSGVHFIRCIKPNESKHASEFVEDNTLNQIRYLGVLETLKIRKESYPVRRTYEQFYRAYGDMTRNPPYPVLVSPDFRRLSVELLEEFFAELDDSQVLRGKSKVFMMLGVVSLMDDVYAQQIHFKNQMAAKIQKAWHSYYQLKQFRLFIYTVIKLQTFARGYLQRLHFKKVVRSAMLIQRCYRKMVLYKQFSRLKSACKKTQTYLKRVYAIKYTFVQKAALVRIQRFFRACLELRRQKRRVQMRQVVNRIFDNSWHIIQNRAATTIQKVWRGYHSRQLHWDQVQAIRNVVFAIRLDRYVRLLQANIRGFVLRVQLKRMRRAACFIQGWFRTHWLRDLFLRVRFASIIIQRRVRKYLL